MFDVSSIKIPEGLVYLDNNATTACAREVVAAMEPYQTFVFGNAESSHLAGRIARRAVESARETVAQTLAAEPGQIFFTSGATERRQLDIPGFCRCASGGSPHRCLCNRAQVRPKCRQAAWSIWLRGCLLACHVRWCG